ncbi:MAG: LppX_LprAFG lipoprotein [Nocardioides sp.]|nr:LppX_LprAFG lipoprotein [Nocardioides sp.]
MRSLTLRKAAIAAALPLALGSLVACGGNNSSSTADDPAATSGAATPKGSVGPTKFLDTMKAAAKQITTARFTLSMDLSGQSVDANGALDMTGDKPAMEISMDTAGTGHTEMRLVDGNMYIQDPMVGSSTFVKMDLSDPNSPLAGAGGALTNFDPQSMIDQMPAKAFRKVTDLGRQTVDGQTLEHYRVDLDTSAAGKLLGDLPSSASLPSNIGYDVWLDDQNRMVKFEMTMKKVAQVTATYSDYGADVNITAPDPSDVKALPSNAPMG